VTKGRGTDVMGYIGLC